MKVAVLILAHKSPEQLEYLIKSLQHKEVNVYLHIDKSAAFSYKNINATFVPVLPNYYCSWGAYNVTRATFDLLKRAHKDNNDYYVLISGEDFPIKPINKIVEFFKTHEGISYINLLPLEEVKKDVLVDYPTFIKRFSFVHIPICHNNKIFSILKHRFLSNFKKLQKKFTFLRFKTPRDIYVGENWFNLNRRDVEKLLKEFRKSKWLRFRLSFGLLMEEVLPHTLLKRSLNNDKWVNDSLRFTIWKPNTGSPEVLKSENISDAINSNDLFARKFEDLSVLKELFNKIKE